MKAILKNRKLMLRAGVLLLAYLSYTLAISKTVSLYRENNKLEAEFQKVNTIANSKSELIGQIQSLDRLMGKTSLNTGEIQQRILDILNEGEAGNHLIGFPSPVIQNDTAISVQTFQLSLEGEFNSLLKTLHKLETHPEIGKVISTNFFIKKESLRAKKLILTLYIQNYKSE